MNDSGDDRNVLFEMGSFIRLVGWMICFAMVFFALSKDDRYIIPFWTSIVALTGGSTVYFIFRRHSEQWRSKIVRSYFSPYIAGTCIWLVLVVTFFILNRICG